MMITFKQGPVYTTYQFGNVSHSEMVELAKLIQCATMARPKGYKYMPRYKNGSWDGYIKLSVGNRFPSGLLYRVISAVESKFTDGSIGAEHEYDDPEQCFDNLSDSMFDGITLRTYQMDAITKLLAYGRGVAKMATNSGKTEVMAAIAKVVQDRILILTTKKDILYQTVDRLGMRLGEDIGIIGDGNRSLSRITIGMIQTLTSHLDDGIIEPWLSSVACVMFDECHHAPSKTAQKVMFAIPAPLRFGFSGTPLSYQELSDLILIGATGPVVVEVTNADLIEDEISARPKIIMFSLDDDDYWDDDWQLAYSACIVNNDYRNMLLCDYVKTATAPSTLILVERIEHGIALQREFSFLDNVVFVTGSDSVEDRQAALEMLRKGNGSIVIATPIFDEGVDVPAVSLLVLAGGGKGHKKLLQRLGRGMRKKEGDNTLTVIDFVDDTNKYLLDHSLMRARIYEDEGFEVEIR